MVKRVGQKKRGKYSRKPKKIILIGTEGSNQTEKKYFTAFNQTQSEYKINVAKGNNTDPEGVMSIPLSEVHAICYRSPHNPLKKSIFFKS